MHNNHRAAIVATAIGSVFAVSAGSAFAHQCVNVNKRPGAGAQVLIDVNTGAVTFLTEGAARRFASGVTTEETFRGLIGIDFDSDGKADLTTYIVGKYGEIPVRAQDAGAECHGIVNIEAYFGCVSGELAG